MRNRRTIIIIGFILVVMYAFSHIEDYLILFGIIRPIMKRKQYIIHFITNTITNVKMNSYIEKSNQLYSPVQYSGKPKVTLHHHSGNISLKVIFPPIIHTQWNEDQLLLFSNSLPNICFYLFIYLFNEIFCNFHPSSL